MLKNSIFPKNKNFSSLPNYKTIKYVFLLQIIMQNQKYFKEER